MSRVTALAYGTLSYVLFFGTFLYAIGFLGNIVVPKTIDSGVAGPLGTAVLVNALLLGVFAIQHSVMARPGFKKWWTRFVPTVVERSTYVLFSSLAFILLFWIWQPMTAPIWSLTDEVARDAMQGLFFFGVGLVLYATCLIDHFDLFGLRQVVLHWKGEPYSEKRFVTPSLYKHIRHPLYVGWFITFWATPQMTLGHLLMAIGTTAYILVAIIFEERDLSNALGADYRAYRAQTPMFIPRVGARGDRDTQAVETA